MQPDTEVTVILPVLVNRRDIDATGKMCVHKVAAKANDKDKKRKLESIDYALLRICMA